MTSGTTRNAVALPIIAKLLPDRVDRISCQGASHPRQVLKAGPDRYLLAECTWSLWPFFPWQLEPEMVYCVITARQVKAQMEAMAGQESRFLESR